MQAWNLHRRSAWTLGSTRRLGSVFGRGRSWRAHLFPTYLGEQRRSRDPPSRRRPRPVPVGDLEPVGVDQVAVVVAGLDSGMHLAAVVAVLQIRAPTAGDVLLPLQQGLAPDVRRLEHLGEVLRFFVAGVGQEAAVAMSRRLR